MTVYKFQQHKAKIELGFYSYTYTETLPSFLTIHRHARFIDEPVALQDPIGKTWRVPRDIHRGGGEFTEFDGAWGAGGCGERKKGISIRGRS